MIKNNKGITLIALIVTIIILLILAGVTIATITGENGILTRARIAEEESKRQSALEELKVKVLEVQTDKKGNATLKDFVKYLEDDESSIYTVSLTKTSSINGSVPDLTSVEEIYVTYENFEFKVDKLLNIEYVGGKIASTNSGNSSSSSSSDIELGECSRYIKVNVSKAVLGNMTLSVDIPDTDNIKTINYFIDDKLVYSGTEKTYKVTGLEVDREYEIYAIVEYNNEKIATKAITKGIPDADIYVATDGNDETGDGTSNNPYASLAKAIDAATDGQKIYICAGTYNLTPMGTGTTSVGISDKDKNIEIFGQNESTILIFDASQTTTRDGCAMCIGSNTVVRNNYSKAIFTWCLGKVENVFFRISGSYKASYLYYNSQSTPNNVINCTFFHDLGGVDVNYSGNCNFNNIATNVSTRGTNTNVIVKTFGTAETELQELIENSKNDEDFISNQAGVFYGDNAWD